MRTQLAALTLLSAITVACDGGRAGQPADRTPTGSKHESSDPARGHCEPGRRLGFVFWSHAHGAEAEKTLTRLLHQNAPGAVIWEMHDRNMTVVVPDEGVGEALIQEARRLGLKIQREDYVGVSARCELDWMNHGDTTPPNPNELADAGEPEALDGGTPIGSDAGTGAPTSKAPKPSAEAEACDAALLKDPDGYGKMVGHQTSVASTRMLLRTFSKACAASFPELAKAAEEASHVGRIGRSRILAAASVAFCPSAPQSTLASSVVAACPPLEGDATLEVWKRLDVGTYAFVQTLKKSGVRNTLLDELILQASLHPELDK